MCVYRKVVVLVLAGLHDLAEREENSQSIGIGNKAEPCVSCSLSIIVL